MTRENLNLFKTEYFTLDFLNKYGLKIVYLKTYFEF